MNGALLKSNFIKHLTSKFSSLTHSSLESLIPDQIFSPHRIYLETKTLEKIKQIIEAFFKMRTKKEYLLYHSKNLTQKGISDPGNHSILMSYDFHLDEKGDPKLIEINTNASFLALGYEMYLSQGLALPMPDFQLNDLKENIENELHLFDQKNGKKSRSPDINIAIVDEAPQSQRLYAEFLVYQELFKSWGWRAQILDPLAPQIDKDIDFIYNRTTDFYFETSNSKKLDQLYRTRSVCFSPHPHEYFLLASKERLIEWSLPGFFQSIGLEHEEQQILESTLLKCFYLKEESQSEAWSQRKKLFFKPKSSFGSKQVYKGETISRKFFESCLKDGSFIAQESSPAPKIDLNTARGIQSFKYDIRCYAYENHPQLVLARLYQGQITNLQTEEGGFAPIIIR